ncbi:hypothetical protein BC939DRAFT_257722 [Gamsiella multidivaricata]|uniref:uncharacterized protein n=1 Tax=Gamsiella multidivaricata TaxID=101098 RepID=UPI00221F155D|nr:uncharacterized protein BC939DRAFT_257722 [Gamsiella multidivaricata]KAI7830651.1 hypothetical protein BC939DRAFT_257722 [Gamsiella multidivaricata]
MSPTIPPWPAPVRSVTGGKQPGKVPKAPLGLGATSDESSDSGSDSGRSSSDAGSENVANSDIDTQTQARKRIGRKTARRRNSKSETIGGKRPAGIVSGKTPPDSTQHHTTEIHARKTSGGRCCCELSSRQVAELPRRIASMVLSKNPVVIKISIPSYLLPLKPLPRSEKPKASSHIHSGNSKSRSKAVYSLDSSDDDHHMDINKPSGTDKEAGKARQRGVAPTPRMSPIRKI